VRASASRIGVDPDSIDFPAVDEWKRQVGSLVDPYGRAQFNYLDGDRLGLETIVDAVAIATQFTPVALYQTGIPSTRGAAGAKSAPLADSEWTRLRRRPGESRGDAFRRILRPLRP
jgi:hypothetical protein